MTPGIRVHVVMPPSLVEGVDAARAEGQSRGDWVRRAVERALDQTGLPESPPAAPRAAAPAPAGQLPPGQLPRRGLLTNSERRVSPSKPASPRVPSEQPDPNLSDAELEFHARAQRATLPKPIPPRVPFRRDVKPFQRGDK